MRFHRLCINMECPPHMTVSLVDPSLCMKKVPCEAQGPWLMTSPTQDWVCLKTKEAIQSVPCEAGFIEQGTECIQKCPIDMTEKATSCVKETKRLQTTEFSKDAAHESSRPLATVQDFLNVRQQRPLQPTATVASAITLHCLILMAIVCFLIYFRVY